MTEDEIKSLEEKLMFKQKNTYEIMSDGEIKKAYDFAEKYKTFMNNAKTEREGVRQIVSEAREKGFKEYEFGKKYSSGDKVYFVNREKAVILCVIGKKSLSEGVKICAAHIDSPRLDLKQNPLYQDGGLALFKTHYYGGIKKYQWTTVPMSLHGVMVKRDGTKVNVNIGEDDGDPEFVVTDLPPHLAQEQEKKSLASGVKGEDLNLLVGSRPFKGDDSSENIKLNILNLLFEKYGVTEEDFLSSELEAVPAFKAVDIGFDRSMIGAYGHDDNVDAYPAAQACINAENPEYTVMSVLTDKEEIGSMGNTGLRSSYMKYFINDLAKSEGLEGWQVLRKSECLSADVTAAYDPTYPEVMDKNNCAYLNKGVAVMKYTGARGKSGTSDCSAEFFGKVRNMLDDNNVVWQLGALGKVDVGGGGTVAQFVADLDVDVVDVGVAVLSMHAPFEVISKTDLWQAYRAFEVFFK